MVLNLNHQLKRAFLLSCVVVSLGQPGIAKAQPAAPIVIMQSPATVAAAMASVNSLCITITYDKNGNRLSQSVANVTTSTTVWGSGTYGCFAWKP
jgi:hypothetical protein